MSCQACCVAPSTVMLLCEYHGDINHEYCHDCIRLMFKDTDKCPLCPKRYTRDDLEALSSMLKTSKQIILQSTDQDFCFQVKKRSPAEITRDEYSRLTKIYSTTERLRSKQSLTDKERSELIHELNNEYLIKNLMN